jgi:hypothetical protein
MVIYIKNWLNYHIFTRVYLFKIWILCLIVAPVLMLAMFIQVLLGSKDRAMAVFYAFDSCGNASLGGTLGLMVSQEVGNALLLGKKWAIPVAWSIDLIMGKNHCRENATVKP